MTRLRFACAALAAMALLVVVGCSCKLPHVRGEYIQSRAQAIPQGATPVFSWQGTEDVLYTYWGRQSATIRVRAWIPSDPDRIDDAQWEVDARTGEGKPLPFIGVERRYTKESGVEMAKVFPPLDLDRMPNGLYIIISPGIEVAEGKVSTIRPVANVCEIRDHSFKPFRFPIPLIPDAPSSMTPMPPPRIAEPEGTAMPL